jgi:hypothetical protein
MYVVFGDAAADPKDLTLWPFLADNGTKPRTTAAVRMKTETMTLYIMVVGSKVDMILLAADLMLSCTSKYCRQ